MWAAAKDTQQRCRSEAQADQEAAARRMCVALVSKKMLMQASLRVHHLSDVEDDVSDGQQRRDTASAVASAFSDIFSGFLMPFSYLSAPFIFPLSTSL